MTTTLRGFDGILFQKDRKVIKIFESNYIQLIQSNNENEWMWEVIKIPKSMNLDSPNIVTTVYKRIKELVMKNPEYLVGLFLFQLKHPEMNKETIDEDELKEILMERIISDINAKAREVYNEGYQERWFSNKTVPASYIVEGKTIDDLLEDCYEEYQDSDDMIEDYKYATEEAEDKWIKYTDNHRIVKEIMHDLKESGVRL